MAKSLPNDPIPNLEADSQLRVEVERMYSLMLWGRWLVTGVLWLTLGLASLWGLRTMIELAMEDFTWASIRYGLHYHPWATIGLALCIAMTLSVLIWQSSNLLFGLSKDQQQYLIKQVLRIRAQGSSHPLWNWVCGTNPHRSDTPKSGP
jgi:hypothetical protein